MTNNLLIENEALRARLTIRDFFLNNTVREIYENVGQVLGLVRMELGATGSAGKIQSRMDTTGLLVGKSIRDLRLMSKSFYPDTDLLEEDGFEKSIQNVIETLCFANAPDLTVKGRQSDMQPEPTLIVFSMLIKILVSLKQEKQRLHELAVLFTSSALQIILSFTDENAGLSLAVLKKNAGCFKQDIILTQGKFAASKRKNGLHVWKLKIPIK